jgi:benzoyl-CoA reductase subunit D
MDIGSSAIKVAVVAHPSELLATHTARLRRREPRRVLRAALDAALAEAGVGEGELGYLASTGEGDAAEGLRTGHFFGMTAHARGALFLEPRARSVLDVGALWARAMLVDARARVLAHRMTSPCAAGAGQFIENVAGYLGVPLDEVGVRSLAATGVEPVSGICAVLAETDVINRVSRGATTPDLLRGIHDAVGLRLAKLLRSVAASSPVLVTGGLAADVGLLERLRVRLAQDGGVPLEVVSLPLSPHAGAIGAAIWGALRLRRTGAAWLM